MGEPTRPEGVRVVDESGTEWPVDVVFGGVDRSGMASWRVVLPEVFVAARRRVCEVRVDVLPARCGVAVEVNRGE